MRAWEADQMLGHLNVSYLYNNGIKASTVKQFLNTSGLPTKWSERSEPMSNQELSKIVSKSDSQMLDKSSKLKKLINEISEDKD